MKFENIEMLIDGAGEITIGTIAPIHCAATGADDDQCLAVLCGRPDESFEDLLSRLDSAIANAIENEIFIDEING